MAPRKLKPSKTGRKSVKEFKATLGDSAGMKHALDSAIIDCLVENGYEVDNTYSNFKLLFGFVAITLAVVAQFWPGTIQENWNLVFCCIVLYLVISTALAAFVYFIEKDAIMITKKGKKDSPPLRISSTMPKFSELYTLIIEAKNQADFPDNKAVSFSNSVGKYFYSDGFVADTAVFSDTVKLLHAFEKKD
eukprot:g7878.t1